MTTLNEKARCQRGVWILAGIVGLIVFILGLTSWHMWWPSALFWGAVVFLVLGLFLGWAFCRGKSDGYETAHPAAASSNVWDGGSAETGHASNDTSGASASSAAGATQAQDAAADTASDVNDVAADAPASEPVTDAASDTTAGTASAQETAANDAVEVKASTPLAGEQELSERKGEWKYEASTDQAANGLDADPAPAASAASVEETEDYDGDGVKEGTDEGSRPEALTAARDGGADNLKEIKGIGPALERLCNELGIYHFDQIAAWSADEVAWMNANLKGFKGRVSRDNWVEQAKILAAGGETEFSKRVEDGGVY